MFGRQPRNSYLARAEQALKDKNYRLAENLANQAMDKRHTWQAYDILGDALKGQGRFLEAYTAFFEAKNMGGFKALGHSYFDKKLEEPDIENAAHAAATAQDNSEPGATDTSAQLNHASVNQELLGLDRSIGARRYFDAARKYAGEGHYAKAIGKVREFSVVYGDTADARALIAELFENYGEKSDNPARRLKGYEIAFLQLKKAAEMYLAGECMDITDGQLLAKLQRLNEKRNSDGALQLKPAGPRSTVDMLRDYLSGADVTPLPAHAAEQPFYVDASVVGSNEHNAGANAAEAIIALPVAAVSEAKLPEPVVAVIPHVGPQNGNGADSDVRSMIEKLGDRPESGMILSVWRAYERSGNESYLGSIRQLIAELEENPGLK